MAANNLKVLAIDDNQDNLTSLKAVLKDALPGVTALTALNGPQGIELAVAENPDVILLDIVMPAMDGFEVCRRLKADERVRHIPVVFLTALKTDQQSRVKALETGADGFLSKPVDEEVLKAQIQAMAKVKIANEFERKVNEQLLSMVAERTLALEQELTERSKVEEALLKANKELESSRIATLNLLEDLKHENQARKNSEEALREREELLRATGRMARIGGWEIDAESLEVRWTEETYRIHELPLDCKPHLEDAIDFFHEDDRDRLKRAIRDALQLGKPYDMELRFMTAKGQHLWTRTVCKPEIINGRIVRLRGTFQDITERKLSAEALSQAKHDWEDTFNSIEDMITIHDKEFNILHYNEAAEQMLGLSHPITPDGMKCYQYYHGKDCPPEGCPSCRCLQTGQQAISEVFEPHLNKFIEVRAIPRFDRRGELTGLIHIVRDITGRKKGEEEKARLEQQLLQAQKMESIGTLAGGVAHDFNNILQVSLGYSELILGDEDLAGHFRADLQKIYESARRGADLVQRLLTFSRKTEIKPQPLNLNRRITELRKMLERTLPKMIDVQLSLSENLATINADPTQIDQVLMNLAVNARDAMPEGGNLIVETDDIILDESYARTHLDAQPGHYVLLTVTDTGSGMEKETLEHIFEPFYTTKGVGEGTGLGLAMVHGIVQQHGGHITCYSQPGQGTTFKIYLPTLVSNEEQQETIVREMPRGGSDTILLVDDEEMIRDIGSRILSMNGYKVVTASNGKEALDVYERQDSEIALVVLDLIMPEMGGKQCLEGLLRLDPAVKVVIASGFSAIGHTKDALAAGAKGFINKPYDIRQVLGVVREVLDAE